MVEDDDDDVVDSTARVSHHTSPSEAPAAIVYIMFTMLQKENMLYEKTI